MSIKKQILKSKPVGKITFSLSKDDVPNAEKVELLGDFNEWNVKKAIELKKFKNGSFKITLDFPVGSEYQFKYLVDSSQWINDAEADKYVNSGIGAEENFVVAL